MNAENLLDPYLENLLVDYDCVVVPQLGGFITNYKPAQIDQKSGVAHPPQKDVSFNKNLTKSDGLLETTLSQDRNISFEEASASLKDAVEMCWQKLHEGRKVQFKKVGVLYIDGNKNLRFEPSGDVNFLKSSFGFDSFKLPAPATRETPIPAVQTEEVPAETPVIELGRSRTSSIYWVAAATMLPFIAMSAYIGISTDFKSPTEVTVADLNPFKSASHAIPAYAERETNTNKVSVETTEVAFPENVAVFPYSFETGKIDSTGVWVDLREKGVASPALAAKPSGLYHIIGGCFGERTNAEKFVSRLEMRGYSAAILDLHKGLYRVKIESFGDYDQALNSLDDMRTTGTFPNAWLLKKPVS